MALAAARVPTPTGFSDWSVYIPLLLVVAVAVLYWVGSRRTASSDRTTGIRRWRTASFLGGLMVVVIALAPPIDRLSETLFWVHMVQHVLLLTVAPPLILLGRPWLRLWRSLPLRLRRDVARWFTEKPAGIWLRRAARGLGAPLPAFVAYSTVLLVWHVPALFDATLLSVPLHVLEHELFFGTALLFWKQVVDSPPLRARLTIVQRIGYLTAAMLVSWVLAIVLALASEPFYSPYSLQPARPGGISALADQHLAAGVMWVPGSIAFVVAALICFHRWVAPGVPERASAPQVGLVADR